MKRVDVNADKRGQGQPARRDAPTRGNEQPVDPNMIEAAMLGLAKRPQEHLGGVVQAHKDGVGAEVEGLAAGVGGDARGEVDAQPPAGQLADGDVGFGKDERRGDVPPEGVAGEVDDVVGAPLRTPGHPSRPGGARIERADPMQLDLRPARIDGRRELTKNGRLTLERHRDPTAAQRDVDRLDLLPAREPSVGIDRMLEQAHEGIIRR